ncbi:MAG: hypothetical protein WAO55_09825 [Candidatus Manganitrophaceae bacterium]
MMKGRLFFIFSCLLFFFTGRASGASPIVVQGNIDDIAKTVLTYFPKVTGTVVSVEGDRVTVDFGAEKGVGQGILLTVYREKEPFFHPVTGVPLGRFEEVAGTIEVDRVETNRLVARKVDPLDPLDPNDSIRVGDGVRLASSRIPLGVVPVSSDGPDFLARELVSALSETGRFRVDLLPPKWDPQESLKESLKRNHLYRILLKTAKEEGRFLIELELQNTKTGRSFSEMAVQVIQSDQSDLILEHLQYQLFQREGKETGNGVDGISGQRPATSQ